MEIIDEGGAVSELKTNPHTLAIAAIKGEPGLGEAMVCGTVSSTPSLGGDAPIGALTAVGIGQVNRRQRAIVEANIFQLAVEEMVAGVPESSERVAARLPQVAKREENAVCLADLNAVHPLDGTDWHHRWLLTEGQQG
ncbi:MAG TPA: hypothetical protein VF798_00130 [Burkholderiaceae bacterium]